MTRFASHLSDSQFHALQLKRSLERARKSAPSPEFERAVGEAVVLAARLQVWSKSGAHVARRRERMVRERVKREESGQ